MTHAIVGVHGIGNFRRGRQPCEAARILGTEWHTRLASALRSAGAGAPAPEISMAYYADLLRPTGRQGGGDGLDDLDPHEIEFARQWLDAFDLPAGTAAGRSTVPVRQAVETLAQMRLLGPPATRWFVALFCREVHAYLKDPNSPARAAIRARVTDALETTGARVVIAHSLGSVVAYEALWDRPDLEVDLLVTLGSPLALPHAVLPRLWPAPVNGRGARPPGVARWVNLADPGDIVAVPAGGIGRTFEGVDTDEHTTIGAFDFHLAKNYLAHRRLGEILRATP
ncbi:serine peptidase [Streptomyces sp. NPDC006971]|uniref:serine peptidase n=1 Tax=Streptomyces sp. NPDC006971 TaxID=3154784 RepID=UPI0033E6B89B